jgi:hypothetical protein
MATVPIPNNPVPIPNSINIGQTTITGANTARDGTGSNLVTPLTAGTNGALVKSIHFHALVTTAAAVLTIFLKIGSTYTLIGEVAVTAVTPSNTAVAFSYDWFPAMANGEPIPGGASIVLGQTIAQNMAATVFGGDY